MPTADQMYKGGLIFMGIDLDTPLDTPIEDVVIPGASNIVVCLTQSGFNGTRDTVDVSSQCNDDSKAFLAGLKSFTYTGTGNAVNLIGGDPAANQQVIADLFNNGRTFWAFLYDESLKNVRFSKAFVSNYTDDNPYATQSTFNFTLQGTGALGTAYPTT